MITEQELEDCLHIFADEIYCHKCSNWFPKGNKKMVPSCDGKRICDDCSAKIISEQLEQGSYLWNYKNIQLEYIFLDDEYISSIQNQSLSITK